MRSLIILITIFFLSGCSTVDIRSSALKENGALEDKKRRGQRLLQMATWQQDKMINWDRFDYWQVTAVDMWKSQFIRQFTPVTESNQKLSFNFDLRRNKAQMKYLTGDEAGQIIGVDAGQTYALVDDVRMNQEDTKTLRYLEPVRDYFFWPQNLVNADYFISTEHLSK